MSDFINCQYCNKPRPANVTTCPYCKPTAQQTIKDFTGKQAKVASAKIGTLADKLEENAKNNRQKLIRTCLICNQTSTMKTWLGNNSAPQFVLILLCFFYLIPGLIFAAWCSGKYKCPKCGTVGKNYIAN